MKIFFISFEYPPIKTAQSIRWNELLSRLSALGYEVYVFAGPANPASPFFDQSYISRFEKEIFPRPFFDVTEPVASGAKLGERSSERFFGKLKHIFKRRLPLDRSFFWAIRNSQRAVELAREYAPDVILTSSPPFGSLILGKRIKKTLGSEAVWIADMGDPWSFASDRNLGFLMIRLFRWLEGVFLGSADAVIVTTKSTWKRYCDLGILASTKKHLVLYQAYSSSADTITRNATGDALLYTGSFYAKIREPFELYRAMLLTGRQLVVAGPIGEAFRPEAEAERKHVTFVGNISHREIPALQQSAAALIFIDNLNSTQLPGKIFEYISTARPIVCIGSSESSPLRELEFADYPIFFCENTAEAIAFAIEQAIAANTSVVGSFDVHTWESRVASLCEFMDAMLSNQDGNSRVASNLV